VAESDEFALDASVAPGRVLPGHPQHQRPHGFCDGRAAWLSARVDPEFLNRVWQVQGALRPAGRLGVAPCAAAGGASTIRRILKLRAHTSRAAPSDDTWIVRDDCAVW